MVKIDRRKSSIKESDCDHWKKINGGENKCFVCEKKFKIQHKRIYIGKHPDTEENLYRHEKCESGSINWHKKFGGRLTFKSSYIKK